jgi:hypothetical protein
LGVEFVNPKVNKPVVFDRVLDAELYEWLQTRLKKGEFTEDTKAYWMELMKKGKKFEKDREDSQ